MILCYLLLAILVIWRIKYCNRGFNADYLSFDTTNTIKGIFIMLVFIKHATPYVINAGWQPEGVVGEIFHFVNNNVGQWIVAMFLFYSGYGIMESIKRKGSAYVRQIPRKRILQVLVNFDIAVIVFVIVDLLLKKPLTLKQCLLSFTGWESVGNSNWYIFIILLMYLTTFLAFYKNKSDDFRKPILFSIVLTLVFCLGLSYLKAEYWYNTMFCYPAGLVFSVYRDKIEVFVKEHYWIILAISLVILLIIDRIPYSAKGLVYNAFAVIFCSIVVLFTMKFKINNQMLLWCGKNLFPLYIYQRVPMIILSSINDGAFAAGYPVLFTGSCLLITVLMTLGYRYIAVKV